MSTKRLALPFLFFTLFLTQCNKNASSPEQPRQMRELTSLEKQVVSADNSFGLKLFKRVNVGERGKNVFISPLSVSMALGMTLNGANGSTRDSMERVLELAGLSSEGINTSYQSLIDLLTQLDPTVTFQIANSVWYRNTFTVEQPFVDVNRLYFNAEVKSLNFTDPAAASAINSWVVRATNGKINTIVDPPIPDDVMMYLINAVYFKGIWTYEFKKEDTHDEIFYLPGGGQKVCSMMNQKGNHRICSLANGATLDLPYGNAGFSMTIFLPDYGTDIENFVDNFDGGALVQSTNGLHETDIDIAVPKFKLEYKASLKPTLIGLGMTIAFTDYADFTKINRNGGLCIYDVLHKTFVDVNEEGTEAAAVTSVVFGTTSVGSSFRVDRPFVFAIRENKSGTILFIGKIVDPS